MDFDASLLVRENIRNRNHILLPGKILRRAMYSWMLMKMLLARPAALIAIRIISVELKKKRGSIKGRRLRIFSG